MSSENGGGRSEWARGLGGERDGFDFGGSGSESPFSREGGTNAAEGDRANGEGGAGTGGSGSPIPHLTRAEYTEFVDWFVGTAQGATPETPGADPFDIDALRDRLLSFLDDVMV